MTRLLKVVYARRRLLVALAFVAFTGVFLTGILRLCDYTWPMAKGNYAVAATYNSPYNAPRGLGDPPPMPPGMDYQPTWDEIALVWMMERYHNYADGVVGSILWARGWQRPVRRQPARMPRTPPPACR